MQINKKGFTLIELLIVIGILAVLATITVLVLNPAQLFAQARDSQRLSDLGSIKGAISLYLTSVPSASLETATLVCATHWGADKTAPAITPFSKAIGMVRQNTGANVFKTDGTGWVSVNLGATTGGSPLSTLPRDPNSSDNNFFYGYACDNSAKTFEINANMESDRYRNGAGSADDVESTDGGSLTTEYETGTAPGLAL